MQVKKRTKRMRRLVTMTVKKVEQRKAAPKKMTMMQPAKAVRLTDAGMQCPVTNETCFNSTKLRAKCMRVA